MRFSFYFAEVTNHCDAQSGSPWVTSGLTTPKHAWSKDAEKQQYSMLWNHVFSLGVWGETVETTFFYPCVLQKPHCNWWIHPFLMVKFVLNKPCLTVGLTTLKTYWNPTKTGKTNQNQMFNQPVTTGYHPCMCSGFQVSPKLPSTNEHIDMWWTNQTWNINSLDWLQGKSIGNHGFYHGFYH